MQKVNDIMKQSQVDEAFTRMAEKIVSLSWEPGKHLSSNQITSELGMSRTPIEKALILLERYGLVTSQSGKVIVSSFNLNDIIELYQVKEAIETEAIKIIMDSGGLTEKQLSTLRNTVNKHQTAGIKNDNKGFFQEGMEFHRLLLEFSGNSRLCLIHDLIRYQNERAQLINILLPQIEDSVNEHEAVIAAIEAGDKKAAIDASVLHADRTIERYREILGSPIFRRAVLEVSKYYQ